MSPAQLTALACLQRVRPGQLACCDPPTLRLQFEEMYEQRRREVNKEFEKYQKQLKAAKKSGSKAAADKVGGG